MISPILFQFFVSTSRRRWRSRRNTLRGRTIGFNAFARENRRRQLGLGTSNKLSCRLSKPVRLNCDRQRANRRSSSEYYLRRLQEGWNRRNSLPLRWVCQLRFMRSLLRKRRSQFRTLFRTLSDGKFSWVSSSGLTLRDYRRSFHFLFSPRLVFAFHHVPDPFVFNSKEFSWMPK